MDELDRILSSEPPLAPSSGFARGVMEAVRREAEEPPPLRFPWARFAIGLLACCGVAAAGTVLAAQLGLPALLSGLADPAPELLAMARGLGYACLAVLGSLGTVRVFVRP
jgi:hypothetical protein